MTPSYLQQLTLQLAAGAQHLEPAVVERHSQWIARQQKEDGGFGGREGESDPYYTTFALRSLWILGHVDAEAFSRAASFLRSRLTTHQSIVDLISLIFGAAICEIAAGKVVISDQDLHWRENVASLLHSLRTSDGGFAKTPEGHAGSTYQTFLSLLCYELLELEPPDADKIAGFLRSQRQPDGGYLEIRAAKRAGVNPTAAAIGALRLLKRLDIQAEVETIEFLAEMQAEEGGFTANTRIPFADMLSTFTALTTLHDLGAIDTIGLDGARAYALSLQAPEGGFYGFALDQQADVEYSFYGVGVLCWVGWLMSNSAHRIE